MLRQDPQFRSRRSGRNHHPHQITGTAAGHRAQCSADGPSRGPEGDAEGRLQDPGAAGLASTAPESDFVVYTNPGATTTASKGSTITLYVV